MSSRREDEEEEEEESMRDKFQQLRRVTHSTSMEESSIIEDASRYIEELKHKVEKLNQDDSKASSSIQSESNPTLPTVRVETLEKGFQINVYSVKNCPGLLVSILESFEELGLEVLDARVSCSHNFHFQAVGVDNKGKGLETINARVVKQTVEEAINNWSTTTS